MMRTNHPEICLFQPEIPQNTGNIGRLAAATGCRLHLIRPFGFGMSDRNLRRPGLDYWPYLDLEIHDDIEHAIEQCKGSVAFFGKSATRPFTQVPPDTRLLVFGRETTGLTPELWQKYPQHFYSIPMFHRGVRSLNLANAVSVIVYDQLIRRGVITD
jgi:tRNA (cytidine/uridine-2'-O-)-methyltransferase